jgi:hypothetical protein
MRPRIVLVRVLVIVIGGCDRRNRLRGNQQHSAHKSINGVVVQYRWHPLYGRPVVVRRRVRRADGDSLVVDVTGSVSRGMPAWMVSAEICGAMALGPPEVAVAALNELRRVLDSIIDAEAKTASTSAHEEVWVDEATQAAGPPPAGAVWPEGEARGDRRELEYTDAPGAGARIERAVARRPARGGGTAPRRSR